MATGFPDQQEGQEHALDEADTKLKPESEDELLRPRVTQLCLSAVQLSHAGRRSCHFSFLETFFTLRDQQRGSVRQQRDYHLAIS